ncbi:hypothetical protein PG984_013187 [Apiospora sp. TS-2023a]
MTTLETWEVPKHAVDALNPLPGIEDREDKAEDDYPDGSEGGPEENDETRIESDKNERKRSLADRIAHLTCLRNFIRTGLKGKVEMCKAIQEGSLEAITFEDLWHLFRPGDLIVFKQKEDLTLLRVYSVAGGQMQHRARATDEKDPSRRQRQTMDVNGDLSEQSEEDEVETMSRRETWGIGTWVPLKLDCFSIISDGNRIGPVESFIKIKPFDGKKHVTDLPVYPVRFHPESEILLTRMEERGRLYLKAIGHKSYDGLTLSNTRGGPREEIQGDVYVDLDMLPGPRFGIFTQSHRDSITAIEVIFHHPRTPPEQRNLSGNEIDLKLAEQFMMSNRASLEPLTYEEASQMPGWLQLMPRGIIGYVFRLRRWCRLEIDLLKDIDQGREARDSSFDDLVIPESYRDMLVGLVENHASKHQRRQARQVNASMGLGNTQIDLVRGKGQGLIVLLHGPPGSGKTSTAETIAAHTRRPLYSITCGDLGLDPDGVESELNQHTTRADKWGCVMLLDEADVFIMQRSWHNIERNALVSVFLRQLEYYSGILFLTTNRPGVIDEAFISRIHISLRYPTIDLDATKKMWALTLNRIERENGASSIRVVFDREILMSFAERHYLRREKSGKTWNGRQIRNAFQIALALGHSQRLKMLERKGITPEQAAASGKRRLMEVKLTKANLQNIAQTTRAFDDYIQHLRGNDSVLARQTEVRDDNYDPMAPLATKDYGPIAGVGTRRVDSFGAVTTAAPKAGKSQKVPKRRAYQVDEEEDVGELDESESENDDDETDTE